MNEEALIMYSDSVMSNTTLLERLIKEWLNQQNEDSDFLQNEDESHSEAGSDVMECFIHNMLANEMTLIMEQEE